MSTTAAAAIAFRGAALTVLFGLAGPASAQTGPGPQSVSLPGSFQSELGCPGDWQPECPATDLTFDGSVWRGTFSIPAGSWEYKVAIDDSWTENYGQGGRDGANFALVLDEAASISFAWDHARKALSTNAPLVQPDQVTVAGSFQSEAGCPGDWQPDCPATSLVFDEEDGVWQTVLPLPAGDYEYKATIDGSWDENYGRGAQRNGGNIPLSLQSARSVGFFFDRATNWIADDVNHLVVTAAGSFQSALGCFDDWKPDCLRSWLQDPDGDGVYTFETRSIPAGRYETKAAIAQNWDENYGEGGVRGGANIGFTVPEDGASVVFAFDAETKRLTVGGELPKGDLREARAHWLEEDLFAWSVAPGARVTLHHAAEGGLGLSAEGVSGGETVALARDGAVSGETAERFPHLAGLPAFRLPASALADVPDILRGQFVLSATDADGAPLDATAVQHAGVLDDLFAHDDPLGVTYSGDVPSIALWAPTAAEVTLHLYGGADEALPAERVIPMMRDGATGTWRVTGAEGWDRAYYLFEVSVFSRETGEIETALVTDPYSLGLSTDSRRSLIVDLSDQDLKPAGWDRMRKRRVDAPEDIALYELHVRDFSIGDETVPEDERGTFAAFGRESGAGIKHLRSLAQAGMTHVHLLPAFDCASIIEDESLRQEPGDLSGYPADSDVPQARIDEVRDQDGFNWCYDPFHFTVPEGSYATEADGTARILEFREMVQGLNRAGLRTVMDVVYNHTAAGGRGDKSVLDKIVPDYYHRLNAQGGIESSTCCANTATENAMMERLMLDSLDVWAREYKVDGFRFDLMGHHSRDNLLKAQDRLGDDVYLYGEGWNFGEVANDARFVQATQVNMGQGTGIGTFNDRIRDAVRGGGPGDQGESHIRNQGVASGLFTDPNALNSGSAGERQRLLELTDWVRIGLAGSIADYVFEDRFGRRISARDVPYGGAPVGYVSDPQEVVNYAAAHDNETLFDILAYKLPRDLSLDERVRMQNLANSIVALSQGVPFFHAGQEMLRSKSMDRNSYNSGDWFNLLDFSFTENGWARGLPPRQDNEASWSVIAPLLREEVFAAGPDDIEAAATHLEEMLKIRASSPFFRLRTGQAVEDSLAFLNTGPDQIPGLVAMTLGEDEPVIMVVINAAPEERVFETALDGNWGLHPVQAGSRDPVVRTAFAEDGRFAVPGRTAAVFVRKGTDWRRRGDAGRTDTLRR